MAVNLTEDEIKRSDTWTCERCSHYSICFVYINISEFIQGKFPQNQPFEVSKLAKICTEFDPIMNIRIER